MFYSALLAVLAVQAASGFKERRYGDLRDWYHNNIHIANRNYNYSEAEVELPGRDMPTRLCDGELKRSS